MRRMAETRQSRCWCLSFCTCHDYTLGRKGTVTMSTKATQRNIKQSNRAMKQALKDKRHKARKAAK